MSLVKAQQKDIQELRQQLNLFQTAQQQKMTTVAHEVQNVEERVSSRLESSLAEFSKEECILKSVVSFGAKVKFTFALMCSSREYPYSHISVGNHGKFQKPKFG